MYKQGLREELILAFFFSPMYLDSFSVRLIRAQGATWIGGGTWERILQPIRQVIFSFKKKNEPFISESADSFECCMNFGDNFIFLCY